jgi:hypothetical protein
MMTMLLPAFSISTHAQPQSRTFAETGKTVTGKFLAYWNEHGSLAQQGLPISGEIQEKSDTDGKTYTVQYFERAVFELHPENQPPNDVLLTLLGALAYKKLYPGQTGAPGQVANAEAGSRLFPETGKHVGGLFLAYWNEHGGLAQQGYPVSEEFTEVSAQDHKPYKVQYFQRAVFELHPENQAPNNVLLSLLGAFRYKAKYQAPTPTATTVAPVQPTAQPLPTQVSADPYDCSGIPANQNVTFFVPQKEADHLVFTADCGPSERTFHFSAAGFAIGEDVGVYLTSPSGEIFPIDVGYTSADGRGIFNNGEAFGDSVGNWTVTVEGVTSHRKAIGHYRVTPRIEPCTNIPADTTMTVTPKCGSIETYFMLDAYGFRPGESVTREFFVGYNSEPHGNTEPAEVGPDGKLDTIVFHTDTTGLWKAVFTGDRTGHQAIGWFQVTYFDESPPPPPPAP